MRTPEPVVARTLSQPGPCGVFGQSLGGATCVCDLQERVPVAANLLSYHLKVLREAGLVTTARRGRWVDYTLARGVADRLLAALPVPTDGGRP